MAAPPRTPGQAPVDGWSSGCAASLRCLKLGPPADRERFSEEAVAAIMAAVEALPCLEAVELAGVSDAAAGALLAAWQAALQQRGRQGCVVQTDDGALRLARVGE